MLLCFCKPDYVSLLLQVAKITMLLQANYVSLPM
jgi:hypothetical protein